MYCCDLSHEGYSHNLVGDELKKFMPVRIYDISKKLGLENKEILAKAKELGITAAKVPSSSLDKITAEWLEEELIEGHPDSPPSSAPAAEPEAAPSRTKSFSSPPRRRRRRQSEPAPEPVPNRAPPRPSSKPERASSRADAGRTGR